MAKATELVKAPPAPNMVTQPATTRGVLAMPIVAPAEVAVYDDIDAVEGKPKEESRR